MKPSPSLLHTLDLTEDELLALLDRPPHGAREWAARQAHPRCPYRIDDGIVVEVLDRGQTQDCARVAPRDLSAGGIGFLHRGTLPGATRVAVLLPLTAGRTHPVTGKVVRCFGVDKDVYDVGVAFDAPVDLQPILASQ